MRILLACILTLVASSVLRADVGFISEYVQVSSNGGVGQWYHLTTFNANGLSAFDGANLGTFDPVAGDTLTFLAAEGNTFKNSNNAPPDDVTGVNFNYSIELAPGGDPHSSFTEVGLGFGSNANFTDAAGNLITGGGDQQWTSTFGTPIDLLSGLADGTYEIQVFMRGTSNGSPSPGNFFANNSGANYTATFTISTAPVPEPATLLSFGLAVGGLSYRRRRR